MGESQLFSVNLRFLLVKLSTLHFFFLDTEGFQKVNEVTTHTKKSHHFLQSSMAIVNEEKVSEQYHEAN